MSEVVTSEPCPHCGTSVFPEAIFCHNCGRKLGGHVEESGISNRILAAVSDAGDTARRFIANPDNQKVAKDFVSGAAVSAGETVTEVLSNRNTKKVAGGALIGASVASILPVVTITAGAIVGAAVIGYKLLTKDED